MGWVQRWTGRGLAAIVALGAARSGVAAQQRPDVVSGSVRTADGRAKVPYALVELDPSRGRQFTDDSGTFRFSAVPPGRYRLVARQVGFRPFDSTVVKVAGTPLAVAVELQPLVVELATITITTTRECAAPGPPDSAAAPQLAALLGQIRENAERYAFLADSYPFVFRLSRTFTDYDIAGREVYASTDTIRYLSSSRVSYRPGQVLSMSRGAEHKLSPEIHLPTLSDFADSAFQANHCFYYAGTVDRDGGTYVRFDFVPSQGLRTPDIEGEVYLDALSHQIRTTTIRLTRVARAMPGLLSTSSTITFAELYPNILILRRMEGELVPEPHSDVRSPVVRSTELRQLLDVHFVRPLPGMRSTEH